MRALVITLFAAWLAGGSRTIEAARQAPAAVPQPIEQCLILTPDQIGQLPLVVTVGESQVQFLEWMAKDRDTNEMVGFRANSADVRIEVTAGDQTWLTTNGEWMQPRGVVGPRAAPISSMKLCES